jgi:hypothetical protein
MTDVLPPSPLGRGQGEGKPKAGSWLDFPHPLLSQRPLPKGEIKMRFLL